jgi:hypothetical protein
MARLILFSCVVMTGTVPRMGQSCMGSHFFSSADLLYSKLEIRCRLRVSILKNMYPIPRTFVNSLLHNNKIITPVMIHEV